MPLRAEYIDRLIADAGEIPEGCYGVVYRFVNRVNGKVYVGQTTRPVRERIAGHWHRVSHKSGSAFHAAVALYGWSAFEFSVVEACVCREALNHAEIAWIAREHCIAPFGYNLTAGGEGASPHPDTVKKIADASKRRKPVSEETRRKLSEAGRMRKHSPETIAKMVAKQLGQKRPSIAGDKHPNFGKTMSDEQRLKLSAIASRNMTLERRALLAEKNRGKKASPEQLRKQSEFMRGRYVGDKNPMWGKPATDDRKRKVSEKLKGRIFTEEHRRKISEGVRASRGIRREL